MVSITDAFPNIELDNREERDYVEIYKFPSINIFPPPDYNDLEIITADVNYRTIDFDRYVTDVENQPFSGVNLKVHDYEGHIPITVTMHEDWGTINELNVAEGLNLYNPKILAEVKKVVVDVVRSDIVGDYNDVYKGGKDSFGSVSVQTYDSALPSLGAGARKAEVTQNIQDLDLGCTFGDRIDGLTVLGGKTGQSFVQAEPTGIVFDNMESTPSFQFNLPARIKPEISYCSQNVEVRWARLEWDYEDVLWSEATVKVKDGPIENVYPRYPSVHVTNRYVHQEFNVEMNFIASMQFNPELGGVILSDPFVISGDFVWDESLYGESDYTIPLYTPWQDLVDFIVTSILPMILLIIVIAVVIYVFVQIGGPILSLIAIRSKVKKELERS